MIGTIAGQQVLSLRRQRILTVLFVSFVAMTALAGVIGWSSHNTIIRVYNQAVKLLAASGETAPPNPFRLKPQLSLLSNMAIYIPLIGALLAIVVGHLAMADDQTGGLGRMIFTRRVSRTSYVAGKILAAAAVLAAMLGVSLAVAIASLALVNSSAPSAGELARLLGFYGLSWLYLLVFALVGMICVLMTRRRSLGLLSALGVWLVVTFAIPQLTSGLRPVASLNPINEPVSSSQAFFRATAKARPVSIGEEYKQAAGRILQTAPGELVSRTAGRVVPLLVALAALAVLTVMLVKHHDYARAADGE
jgi:ABC-type transport system involved in multi-copper enzyme maturation permease subunit